MLPMIVPKAVFWDLDGTLIDSDPYWVTAERALLESYGGTWDDDLADAMQGAAFPVIVRLLTERGVTLAPSEIRAQLTDEVLAMERARLPWIEGVRSLLEALAGAAVPSVLVTGSPRLIAENVVSQAPAGAFADYICGDDDVTPKPDPAPYLLAARKAGLTDNAQDMRQCLIFEDSLPGLSAARASGAVVCAVTGHARVEVGEEGLYDQRIVDYRGLNLNRLATWFAH
ncbi:HAD hydrolase, family IA, variant 3 [Bifidobacterium goeldii]|uniref:HAD hydrolase, family IA, variant 3 n=1 Tax=Bifidobacterium goeldii TaxID=2306975 RepID=A0A430FL16_9BIFI|nr:HAD family phosphatase [Bifidobacterium goeldii]RSX53589.1 HAD hydrolase, family IA, variant 3 [Bifidobacterium goeldii]